MRLLLLNYFLLIFWARNFGPAAAAPAAPAPTALNELSNCCKCLFCNSGEGGVVNFYVATFDL